jgi:hypothetical protein
MQPGSRRSQLFSVRLWPEALSDGRVEWRGEVKHVLSSETRYFREWQALIDFLVDSHESASTEPPAEPTFP